MSSVITNQSALQALQAVNAAGRDLDATQNRITTGLKVAGPRDDGALYGMAQGMRAERLGWGAAGQSLSRAQSALDITSAALEGINEALVRVQSLALTYSDLSLSAGSRQLIRAEIEATIREVDSQARLAAFDGLTFLSGDGIEAAVSSTAQYSLPASPDTPQSFLTPMAAGAATSVSVSMTTRTGYAVPYSPLTPATFAQAILSSAGVQGPVAAGTSRSDDRSMVPAGGTYLMDRTNSAQYGTAGRVDVWIDAFTDPTAFEIWQDGRRVAASGQPYIAGAALVSAAIPVTGQTILSFDHDPADGRVFEIRSAGGGAWAFERNGESGPAAAPAPAPSSHAVVVTSVSSASSLPGVNLRPETSGTPRPGNGVDAVTLDGGSTGGRVDLVFDAFETPDIVEIFQNGVLVAATGQPYVSGGGPVGAGTEISGQTVLSFDYDPLAGQTLEFRFNQNNAHADAGWVVGGLELYAPGSPAIAAAFPTTTSQTVTTSTARESAASLGSTPLVLTPETEAVGSTSRTFTVSGGDKSGRVDLWVEAYEDADVVEVWHNGTRVAASGHTYVAGGGGVGPGVAASPDIYLSFDYDHTVGAPLEFRFNEGIVAPGAWTVAGLVLQPSTAPIPTGLRYTPILQTADVFPDVSVVRTAGGDPLLIPTRNMTAAGLGLTGIDWTDPAQIRVRVGQALDRAIEAAAHFGSRSRLVEALLDQNTRLRDTLESGVGNLVDADLARESARLQAQQVRQQLAAQVLGIANAEPKWVLGLFRP